jgi:hypothetical protein
MPDQIFEPFDEKNVKVHFWQKDPFDVNIPKPGFISDFVLTLRGIRSPTKYQVWSALYLISMLVKRDAELLFDPLRFYFNLFIFLVGPAAIGKTEALSWADENLFRPCDPLNTRQTLFAKEFQSQVLALKKTPTILHCRGTSEGLFKFMQPSTKVLSDGTKVTLGSTCSIVSGELATFLGKQEYNVGLIETLTNLYDCKKMDEMTVGRGLKVIEEPYFTLLGGITADGLAESVPDRAFGDGFLSRVIIVHQEKPTRIFTRPHVVQGGPTADDLRKRLAWVVTNATGRYTFSDEAEEAFCIWYREHLKSLDDNPKMARRGVSRMDVHMRKIACLIRMNRYVSGQVVELQDFKDAEKILKATFDSNEEAVVEVGSTPFNKITNRLRKHLISRGSIQRKKYLQHNSGRGITADMLTKAVYELIQSGEVGVTLNEQVRTYASSNGDEIYTWIGEKNE